MNIKRGEITGKRIGEQPRTKPSISLAV
jgi:hypothetical protein